MSLGDWALVGGWLALLLGVSAMVGSKQRSQLDYFAAGRTLSWWTAGLSNLASHAALGLIFVPAYVALADGGGLTWLQIELAVPLATIAAMVLLAFVRELEIISIYAYLERRFGVELRLFVAGVFLLSRGLITAAILYAAGLAIAVCLDVPIWSALLVAGTTATLSASLGGLRATVVTDLLQLFSVLVAAVVCLVFAVELLGGWHGALAHVDADRLTVLQLAAETPPSPPMPFFGALFGGLFLWLAYHATDLSQAQRQLGTRSAATARLSLLLHGILRFPLALLFVAVGLAVGAVLQGAPHATPSLVADHADALLPYFAVSTLPVGLRGLVIAALLSALLAFLDSSLHALATVTVRDFFRRAAPTPASRELALSRTATLFWGLLVVSAALLFGGSNEDVLGRLHRIGALFYGPILATFLVGCMARRVTGPAMMLGMLAGIGFNVLLWVAAPDLYWAWWSLAGCAVAVAVAHLRSAGERQSLSAALGGLILWDSPSWRQERNWRWAYVGLGLYFVALLALSAKLPKILAAFRDGG